MTTTQPHPHPTPENLIDPLREEAREYVRGLRVFQVHAAVFGAGMAVIFLVNLFTNLAGGITGQWSAWWSVWAFIGWGLAIAVHGLLVRLSHPENSSTANEEKQIEKVLASMDRASNH